MSYTRTRAQTGHGTVLNINTGTASSPTWTPFGEGLDLKPAQKFETEDATNFQSTAREFITTIFDGGEWSFSCNRVSIDTGQAAAQTNFLAGTLTQFQVVAPEEVGQVSVGDSWTFYAYIAEFNPAFEPTKAMKITGKLRTTNGVVYAEGS